MHFLSLGRISRHEEFSAIWSRGRRTGATRYALCGLLIESLYLPNNKYYHELKQDAEEGGDD
jgi:hypothetical protein